MKIFGYIILFISVVAGTVVIALFLSDYYTANCGKLDVRSFLNLCLRILPFALFLYVVPFVLRRFNLGWLASLFVFGVIASILIFVYYADRAVVTSVINALLGYK